MFRSIQRREAGTTAPRQKSHGGDSRQLRVWIIVAVALVLMGTCGSLFTNRIAIRSSEQRAHNAFIASSKEIAGATRQSIQHELDLVTSAQSFLQGDPHPSPTQFARWAQRAHVVRDYPELLGLGIMNVVTASQLSAYEKGVSTSNHTTFRLVPDIPEPFYCFVQSGFAGQAGHQLPPGINVCATPVLRATVLAARSTGKTFVVPIAFQGMTALALETPLYRGNTIPTSVKGRNESFVNYIGTSVIPKVVLRSALQGHENAAVILRYASPNANATFQSGAIPTDAQHNVIEIHGGWSVEAFGAALHQGVFGSANDEMLLFGGVALSLLLGALIYVLGTGRARSMILVAERTDEIKFQALHDPLTNLPNRALIVDRIEQLLQRNLRNSSPGAALYLDIDDFKNVNDTLGHEAGDRLLMTVADRMKAALRGVDTIGRMGGDEFVILIDGSEEMTAPEMVARRLLEAIRQPIVLDDNLAPLVVTASIGIAMGTRSTGSELLRDADVALYQAKAGGKNRFEIYDATMQSDLARRLGLEFELRSALLGQQFHLVYQPIYELGSLNIVAVEALARWNHPLQRDIGPNEFIPILENTGQICEVGAWILHEACRQTALWHLEGDTFDISVNVSMRQLDHDQIIDDIQNALSSSGLSPTSLIIEVTETAILRDVDSARTRLGAIRDLGVRVAIDDFGTGYSSLSYVTQFPVDCIKIDRSFINTMTTSRESTALIRAFIQLGKDLGLKTLAEGVETVAQLDLLRDYQIDEAQGFLFSRPLGPDDLARQLLVPMRASSTSRTEARIETARYIP